MWGSRSLEALYFAVIGQGSKTREEGEKRAPCGGVPATTVATREPGPNQGHQEGGQVLLRADKEEAPGEGALSDPQCASIGGGGVPGLRGNTCTEYHSGVGFISV